MSVNFKTGKYIPMDSKISGKRSKIYKYIAKLAKFTSSHLRIDEKLMKNS